MEALIIFLLLIGWCILFSSLAWLATYIQDKYSAKREQRILEEYEKEFNK